MSIPKILHFCWFGDREPPELAHACLASWEAVMPDYEIRRWGNEQLPAVPYVQTALANRKFANVSDYMRFHILRQHGGIYLDTDVEVLKPFDALLDESMFAGWQQNRQINNAVMGAVPGHPIPTLAVNELERRFKGSERETLAGPFFLTELLFSKRGFSLNEYDTLTQHDDVTVHPTRIFYPYWHTWKFDAEQHVKPDTLCIHHWAATWKLK